MIIRRPAVLVISGLSLLGGLWAATASEGVIGRSAQETPFMVGQLTCSVIRETQSDPSGVAQGRDVECQFRPGTNGAEETYVGTLQGAGQVKTLFERGTVMLMVKQIGSDKMQAGMLAQSYSADAAARSGRSAPLVGDKNNTIVLQPMIEREAGDKGQKGDLPDALFVQAELKLQASPA
jgi:hypothetical protein